MLEMRTAEFYLAATWHLFIKTLQHVRGYKAIVPCRPEVGQTFSLKITEEKEIQK